LVNGTVHGKNLVRKWILEKGNGIGRREKGGVTRDLRKNEGLRASFGGRISVGNC